MTPEAGLEGSFHIRIEVETWVIALQHLLAAALLAANAPRAGKPEPVPLPADPLPIEAAGVRLFTRDDPEYLRLESPSEIQIAPEARSHLVVFRAGTPVLDRGMRRERRAVAPPRGGAGSWMEEGVLEEAQVSADGRLAVVISTRYRRAVETKRGEADSDTPSASRTELTWIDAEHPSGRWTVALEEGRWVRKVIPLPMKRAIAVSTFLGPDDPADLRLYEPGGREVLRMSEDEASVADMTATSLGGFLAVDLKFPPRRGMPDRGLVVLDLLHGTRWTYAWSYGGEGEPVSWHLEDTGILEVKIPGASLRYDRNGKLLERVRDR